MTREPISNDVRGKAVWGGGVVRAAGFATALALTILSSGCGDLTRQGTASSYLIVTSLQAASGAEPGKLRFDAELGRHHRRRRRVDHLQ